MKTKVAIEKERFTGGLTERGLFLAAFAELIPKREIEKLGEPDRDVIAWASKHHLEDCEWFVSFCEGVKSFTLVTPNGHILDNLMGAIEWWDCLGSMLYSWGTEGFFKSAVPGFVVVPSLHIEGVTRGGKELSADRIRADLKKEAARQIDEIMVIVEGQFEAMTRGPKKRESLKRGTDIMEHSRWLVKRVCRKGAPSSALAAIAKEANVTEAAVSKKLKELSKALQIKLPRAS